MSKRMFRIAVWQRVDYLVRAENAAEAKELVDDPVERLGTVGIGDINPNGKTVTEINLEMLEKAKPCDADPIKVTG